MTLKTVRSLNTSEVNLEMKQDAIGIFYIAVQKDVDDECVHLLTIKAGIDYKEAGKLFNRIYINVTK
jgi:hypothetical protein